MADRPFPVANSTKSFWRGTPHSLDNHRSTETLPLETDIAIIGAGYAGASVVHHILKKSEESSSHPSIVILEAREACSGATGRNGGHMKPDPYTRAANALRNVSKEAADEVASFESRHVKAIGDLIKEERIDCDFVLTRASDVCLDENVRDQLKAEVDELSEAGVVGIDDVFYHDERSAEGITGIKGAKGCFTYTAGHVWPYKLILHMLAKAISAGVNLQTHTPVESVSPEPEAEGQWKITTARGSILAKKVIYAANAYTSALIPELKGRIIPVKGICCRIVSPKPHAPLLSNSYVLRFNDWEYDYLIPRTDGSIVVGGARRDFYHDTKTWFDVFDDSNLIEPAKDYFEGYMQRHFRGWEESEAHVDEIWTGIMGSSGDSFPFIGEVPGKPGQYICAGFSGHGMPQAFLSAKAIADMVVDGKKAEEVDLPLLYRSTKERFESKEQHKSLKAIEAVRKKLGLA